MVPNATRRKRPLLSPKARIYAWAAVALCFVGAFVFKPAFAGSRGGLLAQTPVVENAFKAFRYSATRITPPLNESRCS